ncbi:hypothetical protein AJ79_09988 [Helicocarpus griseus UAMH5409]|uniref:K Homology domain-containing protein n=1 Tax=Helicocarpus griseus UAMH5409 TaxID=1447875 RepID=A0A2B7WGA4_9EURO|nr:hypothetical protein AJ79_09988 [Helicocarpus griseus UAMH5409]
MTSSSPLLLLPGDPVSYPLQQPTPPKLSSNVRLLKIPTTDTTTNTTTTLLTPTQPGLLTPSANQTSLTLHTFSTRRYTPTPGDLIIAQIHHSSPDYFHCTITPHTPHALLAQLAFEGATRKTRPMLKPGDLVYARVLSIGVGNTGNGEVEISCVDPATGKAEPGGLGPLVGGMMFGISTGLAERLVMKRGAGEVVVFEELGRKLEGLGGFEVAVGRNGRVWVDFGSGKKGKDANGEGRGTAVRATVAVGRCLKEVDERGLGVAEQKKVVGRVLREMGLAG